MIRYDDPDHIIDVLHMTELFVQESNYGVTYSRENTLRSLWATIQDPEACLILDYTTNGILAGGAIVQTAAEFQKEHFGYLAKFYVLPEYRRTRTPLRIAAAVVEWFDAMECVHSFATATANIGNNDAFVKLLSRYGYKLNDTGLLIRKQYEQS